MATFTLTARADVIAAMGSSLEQAGREKGDSKVISVILDDGAGNGMYSITDASGKVKKH